MTSKKPTRKEVEAKITVRAWKDPTFKELLKKDPHKALKTIGVNEIPADWQITVIEEKKHTWVIRIPQEPSNSKELSEEELQASASGEASCKRCNGTYCIC